MRNVSDKSCREIQHTHFVFSKLFFVENLVVYDIMWKNLVQQVCLSLAVVFRLLFVGTPTRTVIVGDVMRLYGAGVHNNSNNNNNTLIINQQMHFIKFHTKTLKIAPTCFDPKIIFRELRCSLLKSF